MVYMKWTREILIKKINAIWNTKVPTLQNCIDRFISSLQKEFPFPLDSIDLSIHLAGLDEPTVLQIKFKYDKWEEQQ